MSVLDKASLVQIPSGYKSTKLYSQIPSNGNGDFTFSRSSSGTRVNSEGLIEVAKVIGTTEEVTNGDFSSGGGWSGSASISSGQLTKTSGGLAYQGSVVTANKYYKVVVDVASLDGATTLYFGGNQYTLSVGVQTIEAVGGTGNTFVGFNNGYSSGSGSVFNSISVIEYIENDVPRLDYSDGSCASLLLEPQRTNLETKSNSFSTWTTLINVTATSNYIVSPDGTSNATRLQFTSNGYIWNTGQDISSTLFTISCYAKRNNTGTENVGFFVNGSGVVNSAWSLTSDWVRFTYTYTSTNTSKIGIAAESGADVSVFGFQIEKLESYATSYIPTEGATATRTDESFVADGLSTIIGQTEGCIFIDFLYYEGNRFEIFDAANTANGFLIYRSGTGYNLQVITSGGGWAIANFITGLTIGTRYKLAINYKLNDYKIFVNGSQTATSTSIGVPTTNKIMSSQSNGGLKFTNKINQFMMFDEKLTDAELTTLTTI